SSPGHKEGCRAGRTGFSFLTFLSCFPFGSFWADRTHFTRFAHHSTIRHRVAKIKDGPDGIDQDLPLGQPECPGFTRDIFFRHHEASVATSGYVFIRHALIFGGPPTRLPDRNISSPGLRTSFGPIRQFSLV